MTTTTVTSIDLAEEIGVTREDVEVHARELDATRQDITTPSGRYFTTVYVLTPTQASTIRAAIDATTYWSAS